MTMHRFLPLALVACTPELYTSAGPGGEWTWSAPDNQWPAGEPPAQTVGDGFSIGQVPPDFRLPDQFGDEVSLWQFHGKVVLLDISTMWCAPCQELAQGTQATQEEFGEELVYLTVIQEDVASEPPTLDDLNLWADNFGISSPVLGDGDKATAGAVQQGQYPAVLVLGRDLRVVQRVNPPDDAGVHTAISEILSGG